MTTYTRVVAFAHPFRLGGMEAVAPPGTYEVEVEEETLPVSFAATRRVATRFHLKRGGSVEVLTVDPTELDAALALDAAGGLTALAP